MNESTLWWWLAGAAVAVELVTGTFYLLMIAAGLAAGALAAHLGTGVGIQMLVAAVVGAAATLSWHFKYNKTKATGPVSANRDVNLDIGGTVQVDHWNSDGTSSVRYRGANWTVVLAAGGQAGAPGAHRIVEVSGSRLLVKKI